MIPSPSSPILYFTTIFPFNITCLSFSLSLLSSVRAAHSWRGTGNSTDAWITNLGPHPWKKSLIPTAVSIANIVSTRVGNQEPLWCPCWKFVWLHLTQVLYMQSKPAIYFICVTAVPSINLFFWRHPIPLAITSGLSKILQNFWKCPI